MNSSNTLITPSPAEFVKGLPLEAKSEILFALLRELIHEYGGKGLIPFQTADGESLGHYVPPAAEKARFEAVVNEWPAAVREKALRPLPADFDIDDCLTDEELEQIKQGEYPRSR